MSAAVKTWTPGSSRAAEASISTIVACARSERTKVACSAPWQLEVVDVLAVAGDEPRVLAAANSLSDHVVSLLIASRIQAMNTPWKGSRAHSAAAPPGTL